MKNRQLALITTLTIGIFSCSSYRQPESIEAKMARFMPRDINPNKVPVLAIAADMKTRQPAARGIASVHEEVGTQDETLMRETPLSDKRLYFMGLYQQYRNLGKFVSKEHVPEINHCPSFHTTLLNGKTGHKGKVKAKLDFVKRYSTITSHQSKYKNVYFPELSLPIGPYAETPTLGEILAHDKKVNKNIAFQQALKVHLTKTYKELEELCDTGSSSNYYNFTNLEHHIKRYKGKYQQGPQALKTLYKTTIFSNMALIESLENPVSIKRSFKRAPASISTAQKWDNIYQDNMIKKLNISWMKIYLEEMMSNR